MNHNTEQELVNAADTVKKTSGFWKELGSWILYFLFVIVITYLIITFVGQRTKVDGHSMEPALSNGDNLIVDKLSFRFRDPQRYEVPARGKYILYQTHHRAPGRNCPGEGRSRIYQR